MRDNKTPSVSISASWGPSDPEVESIWMLFKDAARKIEDVAMEDEVDFWADRVYEKLNEARNHYIMIMDGHFYDRPITEQESLYNALYAALWSAYKDRLTKLAKAAHYEIGCIFAGDNDYGDQMKAFIKRYPEHSWLKDFVNLQKKNWQDTLRDVRNAAQHNGDLREMRDLPSLENRDDAKRMFILVTRAIEGVGIALISYRLPEYWNVVTLDNRATVFDRTPRFEIRHAAIS